MTKANRNKWQHMVGEFEQQFVDLPKWAQTILLEDICIAVEHRIAVMQRAQARIEGGTSQ